ncbi:MAG: polysulfide reductase [Epsilonproteobacteria bacterium]|nr:MAG: polysulfide reductase [Campylobacterota bacterium]RLA66931.1 MAG: polysulfide reductase [Campylobacterota bacterium]
MKIYLNFWKEMIVEALTGSKVYFLWLGFLTILFLLGVFAYYQQLKFGLEVTNLSQIVSWGAYIANFTFLVGVAAAAVLMVVPAYVFKIPEVKEIVIIAEIMAFVALILCLMFIVVDLGDPLKSWHLIPYIGKLNFPQSVLAWDVIILNGYLLLNAHVPGYVLYQMYLGNEPKKKYYYPFVFLSIFWAISIHTVTAFLYSGLGGKPFWNSAILAPRFLISAFSAGPALLILVFYTINKVRYHFKVKVKVFKILKSIAAIAFPINLFLVFCEVFKEFYTDSAHVASARYLFTGLHGHNILVPYIWFAIIAQIFVITVFWVPKLRDNSKFLLPACVVGFIGIWIEKGMGLIIPGFLPSPHGIIVDYTPSITEIFVCLGIWSFGALLFTMMAKVAIEILNGKLRVK